jgi:hypothetical protein
VADDFNVLWTLGRDNRIDVVIVVDNPQKLSTVIEARTNDKSSKGKVLDREPITRAETIDSAAVRLHKRLSRTGLI